MLSSKDKPCVRVAGGGCVSVACDLFLSGLGGEIELSPKCYGKVNTI